MKTPIISEKSNKMAKEAVIASEDEEQRAEKRKKLNEDLAGAQPSFSLQLGDEKNVPSSPRTQEYSLDQVPLIKQFFSRIAERNQKITDCHGS